MSDQQVLDLADALCKVIGLDPHNVDAWAWHKRRMLTVLRGEDAYGEDGFLK